MSFTGPKRDQHATRDLLRLVWQSALLAALAFAAIWIVASELFDDSFAQLVLSLASGSYVAVGSGITGFLLAKIESAQTGHEFF